MDLRENFEEEEQQMLHKRCENVINMINNKKIKINKTAKKDSGCTIFFTN